MSVNQLVSVKQLGYLGAIGATAAFLISVTLVPALLSFMKRAPKHAQNRIPRGRILVFAAHLTGFAFQYRKLLSIGGVALFVISLELASQIKVDTDASNYFKPNTPIRQTLTYFNDTFNSEVTIEVMVDTGERGGVKNPEVLQEVVRFQEYLEGLEHAGEAQSIVDYIRKMNQSMHNDNPDYYTIPGTRNLVAQYLLLYESTDPTEDLTDLKTHDERFLRITWSMKNLSAVTAHRTLTAIRETLAHEFPTLNVELTGPTVMYNAQDIYVQQGVVYSFALVLLLIGLSFIGLFRSFKYGLLALSPSLLPILTVGSIMTLFDISLDLGTMIVGAVTMGLAVDDSIHVMNRYLQAHKEGHSVSNSLHLALTESGHAIILSSMVLIVGFGMMLFGSFVPFIYAGCFSTIIMSMALLGDLVILPDLLFLIDGSELTCLAKGQTGCCF